MILRIYIDGYNLYYGSLKHGPHKWLDPVKLIEQIVRESAPPHLLNAADIDLKVKYFTSLVEPKVTFSKTAKRDQEAYHSALLASYSDDVLDIIFGYHSVRPYNQRLVDKDNPKALHPDCENVSVWRIEEKQTDVNIAVEAMKDALTDTRQQHMVFVSNDTDFVRLYETLQSMEHVNVGIVTPGFEESRSPSPTLARCSSWLRLYFNSEELEAAQFPYKITEQHRERIPIKLPIRKPMEWFGQRQLALEIFDVLFAALRKRNKVFQWLEQEPYPTCIEGLEPLPRPAIEMLDDVKSAEHVLRHAEMYAAHISNGNDS
ncbi:NYN domain-containing protein [Alteromonas gilva]|uniref:NYN domain-containing protein n=1 Tax=Alteromonas gilva TaxID=2987522 RepID=A0ABT5L7C7_9ALTE|nr:NYN domain-containing protein [Alteromonas gilva]MDC8832968.1 NYN domain-containing protein [Alteromonas gilva]